MNKIIQLVLNNGSVIVGYKVALDKNLNKALVEKPILFKEPTLLPADLAISATGIIQAIGLLLDTVFMLDKDYAPVIKREQFKLITKRLNDIIANLNQFLLASQMPKASRFYTNLLKTEQYKGSKGGDVNTNPYIIEIDLKNVMHIVDFEKEYERIENLYKNEPEKLKEAKQTLDTITNELVNEIEKQYDYELIAKLFQGLEQTAKTVKDELEKTLKEVAETDTTTDTPPGILLN